VPAGCLRRRLFLHIEPSSLPALRPSRRVTNHSCTKCRQPSHARLHPLRALREAFHRTPGARCLGVSGTEELACFAARNLPALLRLLHTIRTWSARAWRAGGRPSPAPWKELLRCRSAVGFGAHGMGNYCRIHLWCLGLRPDRRSIEQRLRTPFGISESLLLLTVLAS